MGRVFNALVTIAVISVAYSLGRMKGHEEALYAVAIGRVDVELEEKDGESD